MTSPERQLEEQLLETLRGLKYGHREDIRDRAALEKYFRDKFEALNRVRLTAGEFQRLLDKTITPDAFINDWCKNTFEVVSQLRINTDYSHHRYDVLLLINGVPVVQIELKTLRINPRRAIEQIVEYKNDPGKGKRLTL
jgi:type I restriction enzyme R subunit